MVFKTLIGLGLLTLAIGVGCSGSDSDAGPGAAGTGTSGGASVAGQGGGAGSGSSKAGSPSAGTSSGGGGGPGGGGKPSASGGDGNPTDGGAGPIGGAGAGGAAPDGGQVIAECLDAPLVAGTRTEALELWGDGLTLAIVRRVDPDAIGTSGTTIWLAQRFGLVRGGVAECLSDVQDLDYTVSHHNFDDVMTASYGAETWIFSQTRQEYGIPATFRVEARQGDTLVWGPVTLTLVGCQELRSNVSCSETYLQ